MRKSVRKFFWLFFTSQEQWLNRMSDEGWQLVGTTISEYEFEECEKGKYRYKENDGTAFELCASFEQRYGSYQRMRLLGVIGLILALALAVIGKSIVWGIVAILPLIWTVLFHLEIRKLKKSIK